MNRQTTERSLQSASVNQDVKQAVYFDKLRKQETPHDKELFLSLTAYQGNDEMLLIRKAQVLLNLQKISEAYNTLKGLQSPLAVAINNLALLNLGKPYRTDYNFTGEAYAMLLVSKYHESFIAKNYFQCLEIANQGIAACTALGMSYQANVFKTAYSESLRLNNLPQRCTISQTGNLIQASDAIQQEYKNALQTDISLILEKNYTPDQKLLAKATQAAKERNYELAISLSSQIKSLNAENEAILSLLRLDLYARTPGAKEYLQPEISLNYLLNNARVLEFNAIETMAVRLYPLGALYAKLAGANITEDNYILKKSRVFKGNSVICNGIPEKLEMAINKNDYSALTAVDRHRVKVATRDIEISYLITQQQIENVKRLI